MPTGAGKTRIAMNLISQILREADPDKIVIWLAHSEELCEQAAEEFEKSWSKLGDRPVGIYRHFGPYRTEELTQLGGGLLVASLALLYQQSGTNSTSFFALAKRANLIVMDEAHQAIAPTYQLLLNLLSPGGATPILGLSATPGRSYLKPEEDLQLASFFARQKVTLRIPGYENPIQYLVDEGYLAKAEYRPLPYFAANGISMTPDEQKDLQVGFDLPERVLKHLANDHLRNLLIIKNVMQEADQGGKIIVFGCSVEHAILLGNILRVKGYNAASVTSATPLNTRRRLISEYRTGEDIQILTNFGVLTTGFDAPRTNVAVIARPTSSVVLFSQMVGRAARGPRAGGNSTCHILTVVDQIPGFRSMAEAFTFWDDIWAN
jgi:superfamily II DNA or RNA helicase